MKFNQVEICKDEDSHTYIVPKDLVRRFNELNECDEDDIKTIATFNKVFSKYRVDGIMPDLYIQEVDDDR